MTTTRTPEQERNLAVARQINEQTKNNPDAPYYGKYITVLGGEVVAEGRDLDEMTANLEALGVDYSESVYLHASMDYDRVYNIGGFR